MIGTYCQNRIKNVGKNIKIVSGLDNNCNVYRLLGGQKNFSKQQA